MRSGYILIKKIQLTLCLYSSLDKPLPLFTSFGVTEIKKIDNLKKIDNNCLLMLILCSMKYVFFHFSIKVHQTDA